MLRGPANPIVNMIRLPATERNSVMFMIVTYPWPVASAHVELTGPNRRHPAVTDPDADDTIDQHAPHIEQVIGWTDRERLRFQWYRYRIAINDICRRPVRTRPRKVRRTVEPMI
jgi:hypothetical protein